MAEELHELAVKVTPEGMEQTREGLDDVGEAFDETAETATEGAEVLDDMAEKWSGAMSAIVGGLAVATAGLLSKVPVVKETMTGLETIITSLALKIDDDLRGSLNGFNRDLVDTASRVRKADGTFDGLLTAIDGVNQAVDELLAKQIQAKVQKWTGMKIPKPFIDLGIDLITSDVIQMQERFRKFFATVQEQSKRSQASFNTMTANILDKFTGMVNGLILKLNEWIRHYNNIPGTEDAPLLKPVANTSTFQTNGRPGGGNPGGPAPRGNRGRPTQNSSGGGGGGGGSDGAGRVQRSLSELAGAMRGSTSKTTIEINGQKVAEAVEFTFADGVRNRGRFSP